MSGARLCACRSVEMGRLQGGGSCSVAPQTSLFQRQHFSQTASLLPVRPRGDGQLAQVTGAPGRPLSATTERDHHHHYCCYFLLGSQADPHRETEALTGRPLYSLSAVPPLSPALISGTGSVCALTLGVPKGKFTPSCLLATLLLVWST